MACERSRRLLVVAAVAAMVAALAVPAAGHAADSEKLASAGVLARGAGYESATGSDAVRVLQRRLRHLGNPPGPIDGLYGPLTEGAVERFQQRHGLAVDGIVGRQTKRSLYTPAAHPAAVSAHPETHSGRLERKSPAPHVGAESADELQHARPATTGVASRDGPARAPDVPSGVVALLVGLSMLLLVALLWARRHRLAARVNVGLACAALLGVFGIGAAAGAIFATKAAPGGAEGASAQSGVLLTGAETAARTRHSSGQHKTLSAVSARGPAATPSPAAATPPAAGATPSAPEPAPRPRPVATAEPARRAGHAAVHPQARAAYVVQRGDSLSRTTRTKLRAQSSAVGPAEAVEKLTDLNIGTRIRTHAADLIEADEGLKLP
jgi:peptidoglycan hydrolase-like protein with peptidoglycan-binding domain